MKRNPKDFALLTLKGIAMGAADVVPGVSGGTIAFITGIYEELINSIKSININAVQLLLKGQFKAFWQAINGNFLLFVFLGIAISVVSLAKLLAYLLLTYPILVWSFFFGLIVASAIYVAKKIRNWNINKIIFAILGAITAYGITIVSPAEANTSWWFVVISGAIAICAMILPGISGSFILLLLGMYAYVLTALSNFNLPVILIFLIGAVIGIIAFSNILSWLLRKYHDQTIAVLTGFMIGSLNKVWPWKNVTQTFIDRHGAIKPLIEVNVLPQQYQAITGNKQLLLQAIITAIIGFAIIFVVEGLSKKLSKKT